MKKVILLLFILLPSLFFAQLKGNLDSVYYKKILLFKNRNVDSLFYYSDKLMQSEDLCLKYTGFISRAFAYYKSGDFDTAEEKSKQLLKELENEEDICFVRLKSTALRRLFWINYNKEKFNQAFEYCLLKEELIKKFPDKEEAYRASLSNRANIASIKIQLGLYDESVELYKQLCKELSTTIDKQKGEELYSSYIFKASVLNRIGDAFLYNYSGQDKRKLDSAYFYYKEAYSIAYYFDPPHKDSEAIYDMRRAKVLRAEGKFKEALKIIETYEKDADEFNIRLDIHYLEAILYSELGNHKKAVENSKKFLSYPKTTPSKERYTVAIYNVLADSFHKMKMRDSAYVYSQMAIAKLNSQEQTKLLTNQSYYLYDISKVNALNKTLKEENDQQEINFIILSGSGLLAVLALFVVYRKQQRKKITDIVKTNQKEKKEYNIDSDLELKIIHSLETLDQTDKFLDANFNLTSLAQELNTNTTYISNILNDKKGVTFKQYIIQLRIEHLIKLLKSDTKFHNYTVKALAEEIGYTNASSFTRAFKNYTGKTPSEFLKSI